jgi:protein SCO1/2
MAFRTAGEAAMKRLFLFAMLLTAGLIPGLGHGAAAPDPGLFSYRQHNGSRLPSGSVFQDSDDSVVHLDKLSPGMPLILVLGYFHCPNLCGLAREDLFEALHSTALQAGRDYALALLSIDPAETTADARAAKMQDVAAYGLPGPENSWHYLTGSAGEIQPVADAVGFRDQLDQSTKQFIHPAGIVFVTAAGTVSSYLLGIGYTPTDVRSAIERAGAGQIVEAASPVLLLCFHFDPTTGRYTLEIMKLLRLTAVLTVATVAGTLFLLFRRERNRA